jgi:hypothetical protein
LRHLIAEDYPFPWTKAAFDHILTTPGLSDTERVAILGETVEKHGWLRQWGSQGDYDPLRSPPFPWGSRVGL